MKYFHKQPRQHHHIEIKLTDVSQLFNSMDPSPFHEKDLDKDAEEFIVSRTQEYHRYEPVTLVIHLVNLPAEDPKPLIENAVHHYFAYRAKLNLMEFKRLMKQGRSSLFIGLLFLATCLLASEYLGKFWNGGPLHIFTRESLTIAGWVAMWQPMEIYLYKWWPLRSKGLIYKKLSKVPVKLQK